MYEALMAFEKAITTYTPSPFGTKRIYVVCGRDPQKSEITPTKTEKIENVVVENQQIPKRARWH